MTKQHLRPAFYVLAALFMLIERLLLISDVRHAFGIPPIAAVFATASLAVFVFVFRDAMSNGKQ